MMWERLISTVLMSFSTPIWPTQPAQRLYNPDCLFLELKSSRPFEPESLPKIGDELLTRIRLVQTGVKARRVILGLARPVTDSATREVQSDPLMGQLRSAVAKNLPITDKPESSVPAAPVNITREGDGSPAVPAKPTSTGDRTLTRALGLKVGTVVIDPGHGGRDSGCISPGGLREKEVALDVARRLGVLIEQRLGAELIYTRSDDSYIGLQDRTRMANEKGADLFLSIHVNSSAKPDVSGVESYYLNFTATPADLDVAAQENAGSEKTIHDLNVMIQKISGHEKTAESKEFAATVQGGLLNVRTSHSVTNRGVRTAPFVVLIGATMPAVLVELGFLSNSRDESLLQTSEHRERLAKGLYQGLSEYVKRLGQFRGVAPVFVRSPVSDPTPVNPWPAPQAPDQNNRTLPGSALPIQEIGIGICVVMSWVLSFRILRRFWDR